MDSFTLMTFLLECPNTVHTVELVGSWDNFSKSYAMKRDPRRGAGLWTGCFTFTDIICDGDIQNLSPPRDGGLRMGGLYWYYYKLDGHLECHDSREPSTTSCPLLPGQSVNILDVPCESRSRRSSLSSISSDIHTLNPADKYINPKSPLTVPISPRNTESVVEKKDIILPGRANRPRCRRLSLFSRPRYECQHQSPWQGHRQPRPASWRSLPIIPAQPAKIDIVEPLRPRTFPESKVGYWFASRERHDTAKANFPGVPWHNDWESECSESDRALYVDPIRHDLVRSETKAHAVRQHRAFSDHDIYYGHSRSHLRGGLGRKSEFVSAFNRRRSLSFLDESSVPTHKRASSHWFIHLPEVSDERQTAHFLEARQNLRHLEHEEQVEGFLSLEGMLPQFDLGFEILDETLSQRPSDPKARICDKNVELCNQASFWAEPSSQIRSPLNEDALIQTPTFSVHTASSSGVLTPNRSLGHLDNDYFHQGLEYFPENYASLHFDRDDTSDALHLRSSQSDLRTGLCATLEMPGGFMDVWESSGTHSFGVSFEDLYAYRGIFRHKDASEATIVPPEKLVRSAQHASFESWEGVAPSGTGDLHAGVSQIDTLLDDFAYLGDAVS